MVSIREAVIDDASAIARVHADTWRTTYRGIVPDDYLNNLSYERSRRRWEDSFRQRTPDRINLVAEDESGLVVGFASGCNNGEGDAGYTGQLQAIYVLACRQKQGVGRRLVRAVAEALSLQGHTSMIVWVLSQNPARAFYEVLGGQILRTKTIQLGGHEMEETQYGWGDIALLVR